MAKQIFRRLRSPPSKRPILRYLQRLLDWLRRRISRAGRPLRRVRELAQFGKLALCSGCLVSDAGDTIVLPVFPYGRASWDGPSKTFIFKGRTYTANDSIELSGRLVKRSTDDWPTGKTYLPKCEETGIFLVNP